jgi:hypothetical protein
MDKMSSAKPVVPFAILGLDEPTQGVMSLFQRAFKSVPPDFPRHFAAIFREDSVERVAGYIHFTKFDDGVFLCGGLCVDASVYRRLSPEERSATAMQGSLSRWLSVQAIAALGPKRAVFAYTGDARSRRDAAAIGFKPAGSEHLFVQWHDEPVAQRQALLARVAALGPF